MKHDIRSVPSKARRIVVDEVPHHWMAGGPGIVVWGPSGKRHLANVHAVTGLGQHAFERGQSKRTGDGMITPFDVANWIRVNLLGHQAKGKSFDDWKYSSLGQSAEHPVGSQPNAYVVTGEQGEYEDWSLWVVEVSLDPQVAKDVANALNEFGKHPNLQKTIDHLNMVLASIQKELEGLPYEVAKRRLDDQTEQFLNSRGIVHREARRILARHAAFSSGPTTYRATAVPLATAFKPIATAGDGLG